MFPSWHQAESVMGNNASSQGGTAAGEWKGPFSDEEYECLVTLFKSFVSANDTVNTQQTKLQEWLDLPGLDATLPEPMQLPLGSAFHRFCLKTREAEGASVSQLLRLGDFVRGVAQCTRASSTVVLRSLFSLFASDVSATYISAQELSRLIAAVLVMADGKASAKDDKRFASVVQNLTRAALAVDSSADRLSSDGFIRWSAKFPLLYSIFSTWMARKCFGSIARPSYSPSTRSEPSDILSAAQFACLSAVANPLQNQLDRLYTSTKHGLSFNRLCYHVLGYSGPTLVIIQDTGGAIFGMFCDTEWKESSRYYGGNGCFLFRLEPEINVYRVSASGANENYMYLNSKGFALPRGLGMGGEPTNFRLFLSEDFDENCYSTSKCLSFESGRLSTNKHFTIDAMEVWGCGGQDSQRQQQAHRQETADLINRARKVDKAQFMGNDFDKEFFLSKTFGHGADRARMADDEEH